MQLLQRMLYFIDIKLWHIIKDSIFPQENERFHHFLTKQTIQKKGHLK